MSSFKYKLTHLLSERILTSRTFLKNFFILSSILVCIFLLFSVVIFSLSRNVISTEFISTNKSKINEASETIDENIGNTRYVISSLENNSLAQAFFFHESPTTLYNDFYSTMLDTLNAYVTSSPMIDSIYLYSIQNDSILTHQTHTATAQFADIGWLDNLDMQSREFQIIFRKKHNDYPYLLSIAKVVHRWQASAVIVVNIDLRNVPGLAKLNSDTQSVYLISYDQHILYRETQADLSEDLHVVPELVHFRPSEESYAGLFNTSDTTYTYVQQHSARYPWSYVLITQLPDYQTLLSESETILIVVTCSLIPVAFLFSLFWSLRSVRPIHSLIALLDNAEHANTPDVYNDSEMQHLADRIAHYIYSNQVLTDELSAKLNLLNQTKLLALQSQINPHFLFNSLNVIYFQELDALGFDHPIPKLTLKLSRLLRYAIESADMVSLEKELEFSQAYIAILKESHNNKPTIIMNIDENALQAKVPKLFIQPLLENAVFHGLASKMDDLSTITISCSLDNGFCKLTIADNGIGMTPEMVQHLKDSLDKNVPLRNSIGIKNVVTRMMLLFGEDFSIDINSVINQGSSFVLRFPFTE